MCESVSRQGRTQAGTPSDQRQSRALAWIRSRGSAGEPGRTEYPEPPSTVTYLCHWSLDPQYSRSHTAACLMLKECPSLCTMSSVPWHTSISDTAQLHSLKIHSPRPTGNQDPLSPLPEEGQFFLIPDKVIVFLPTKYQERVNT